MKAWKIIVPIVVVFGIILILNHTYGWFIIYHPVFEDTYVSLRFDDGWKTQLNAYNSLKKYNLTGSIYIITNFMGKEGYMNWSDVKKVSEIMEIGAHTRNHADLINTQNLDYEIGGSYNDLVERGYNVATFVYPYGNYNREAVEIVEKYFECASTQDVGINTPPINPYLLKDFTFRSLNDIDDVKRVIKPGTWTILTFHDVGEPHKDAQPAVKSNAISVEFFEQILEYLVESDTKVITIAEGCDMLLKKNKK